jgi:hypothetical protein
MALDREERDAVRTYQRREIDRVRWLRQLAVTDNPAGWVELRHADHAARERATAGAMLTPSEQEAMRLMRVLSRWLHDINDLKLQYRKNAADHQVAPRQIGRAHV